MSAKAHSPPSTQAHQTAPTAPLSRRALLVSMAAAASAIGWSWRRDRARAQSGAAAVLNDLVTVEGLLVTFLGVARTRATDLVLDENTVRLLRAAQCQQDAHFNNLVAEGGSPEVGAYTIADAVFENPTTFLTTWTELENIMVGMYMAAGRAFAEAGEPRLVEVAFAAGAVDAQHQALLRQLLGERLPANRAFVDWQFGATSEGVRAIRRLGFIGGSGTTYDYPGPGDRYCRGVTGLVIETTDDQSPPEITPDPNATPVANE